MTQIHAAEKILQTFKTILTTQNPGYPTDAGAEVFRKRVRAVSEDDLPIINIVMGLDDQMPFSNVTFQDSMLEVVTELMTSAVGEDTIEPALNELRRQVHKALMADTQLGLNFVHLIVPSGAKKPEPRGLGDLTVTVQEVTWKVTYRTLIQDPSVTA
jgi:hypothetical protein